MNAAKRGGGTIKIALSELGEFVPSAIDAKQAVDETILTEMIYDFSEEFSKQQHMEYSLMTE